MRKVSNIGKNLSKLKDNSEEIRRKMESVEIKH